MKTFFLLRSIFRSCFVLLLPLLLVTQCFNFGDIALLPPSESVLKLNRTSLYTTESRTGQVGKVLLIPIQGEILGEVDSGNVVYPGRIQRLIEVVGNEKNISAILVKVNSPGGSASASDAMYRMISRFANQNQIPVYVHIDGIGASGGYYVAMAGSKINAAPVSIVGSIGVIIRTFGVQGLMEKVGVEYRSIKSGKNKDILSPFQELNEDQKKSLQTQINQTYEEFLQVVLKSRKNKISESKLRQVADGNIYNAEQAKEMGLIDSILPIEDFIEQIRNDLRLGSVEIFSYLPEGRKDYNIYNTTLPSNISIEAKLNRLTRSGVFYLWEGGL
ncbi:MAG: signal peptide peptidase SppA [Leptonema sp. (in: Bacteria)]|nr:signal peptide peptidase SppA [Leptonema sp. (in: bacteria)]